MAIKIEELSFVYPNGREGLQDINLHIKKGKKTAILGVNGSGKSTLLYHLDGIKLPQKGKIEILDLEMKKKNLKEIRRDVGFLFDYPDHQLFSTTVYQDIKFGLDNYKFNEEIKDELIINVASKLGIEDLLEFAPYELSLGQKKKVAIAGLLVLKPKIILCDEPFSGLDGYSLIYFKSILDSWADKDKSIIFSTHDVDLTYEWADEVIVLNKGRVLKTGTVEEVLMTSDIYEKTELVKPMLYELFEDKDVKPRSLKEAQGYI